MPIPYRSGSEEFYRSRPILGATPSSSYNRDTLDLMREQTERNVSQRREIGKIYSDYKKEEDAAMAGALQNGYQGYREGKADKRTEETHAREGRRADTEEANARENMSYNRLQQQEAMQRMEAARKDQEFKYGPTSDGKSRAELEFQNKLDADKLGRTSTQAQIAANNEAAAASREARQFGTEDRRVAQLAKLMTGAISSNNQAALATARAQGAQMGLNPNQIQLAEQDAATAVKQGGFAQDLTFTGSTAGALTSDRLVDIDAKQRAVRQFTDAAQAYKASTINSTEYDNSLKAMKEALRLAGKDESMIDRIGYIGPRDSRIDSTLVSLTKELTDALADAKTISAGSGPGTQKTLGAYENVISNTGKAGGAGPLDVFGTGRQSGPTMLQNAVRGVPQQQGPAGGMQPVQSSPVQQRSRFNRGGS